MIELKNYGITEYCMFDKEKENLEFYHNSQVKGFTGLYFRDNSTFFALYPTQSGPMIYYAGKEYSVNKGITITLQKGGKNRKFKIDDYGIVIDYLESPYIGFDVWSDEIDVDLFFRIFTRYKSDEFYERYTLKSE